MDKSFVTMTSTMYIDPKIAAVFQNQTFHPVVGTGFVG